jgi:hypothetical protein
VTQLCQKDTGLNVGSDNVTGDVEIDSDELALPTGNQAHGEASFSTGPSHGEWGMGDVGGWGTLSQIPRAPPLSWAVPGLA